MGMRLYDTARQAVVPFEPGPVVKMYTCGITPYDAAHVGFAALTITYDVLQRRLRDLGHETQCVRNITDIDDSILGRAREFGVNYLDLAAEELARIDDNLRALDIVPSFSEPRATSAIPDILGFIGMVLETGHAYQADGAVYFDISTFDRFGQISHLDRDTMLRMRRNGAGTSTIRPSATPSTSFSGRSRSTTSRRGSRSGVRGGRAGTSSARHSRCASSGPPSICTAGARI